MSGAMGLSKPVCARPDTWPAADQAAWAKVTAKRAGPFRHQGGGRQPSFYAARRMASDYGRWITFLAASDDLDPREAPTARPTRARLDAYYADLRTHGNRDHTVVSRFDGLRAALQLMCPEGDFRDINRPDGISLRSRLPMETRNRAVPDCAVLLSWAIELFEQALTLHKPRCRHAQVREALLIAILAVLAPRLRALSSIRLGVHLRKVDREWLLDQHPSILKTGPSLEMPLPREVARILERYLQVERVELLGKGKTPSDALWISARGTPLAQDTIVNRIRIRAKRRFGEYFGTHAFRASLATKQALDSPETPLDASTILGHRSSRTTRQHYNRATAVAAGRRHSSWLQNIRHNTAGLASRLFPDEGTR